MMMTDNNIPQAVAYRSLVELRLRKEQIRNAIHKDNSDIADKWRSLFKKPEGKKKKSLTVSSLVNTGAGVFDGFLFAWKLYRKFHR